MKSRVIRYAAPLLLFFFMCWIIYDADRGMKNVFIDLGRSFPYGDKVFHLLLYGLLAYFTNLALHLKRVTVFKRQVLLGALLVLVFAIFEEFTQLLFKSRQFDLLDMVSDIIGIWLFSRLSTFRFHVRFKKSGGRYVAMFITAQENIK